MRRGTLLASLAVLFAGQAAAQDIVAARYAAPTDRYGHRVLGAGGEWAALILDLADGTVRVSPCRILLCSRMWRRGSPIWTAMARPR